MKTDRNRITVNSLLRSITILVVVILLLSRSGGIVHGAGLLVADGGFGGVLEIVEHDVQVTINNGIAVTRVSQVFLNKENRQVEALYTFPVPREASVANFSMWINGKEMIGEVLEKKRAREIYNSYKQRRRDPGLLEQKDYKTFEMRIFPIGPKAKQRIQVTYYQELEFDHDWATYVYPLSTTTRSSIDSKVGGRFSMSANIKSAVPISALQSPSHGAEFLMVNHTENYHEASLETQDGDLARDVVLAFQVTRPMTGMDLLTSKNKGEDGYFVLTLTAGKELEKMQTGADYVFILDISGSMANKGKLETSVRSLESFINNLAPDDRFEVITFNKKPYTMFNKLQNAGQENIARAVSFLNSREARGGTVLAPALATAYKYGSDDRQLNTVILSDGITEQKERAKLIDMIRSRPVNARVFCIGVGNEINRSLLRQMAEDAGGLAAFLSQEDDFERQARAFRRKLMHPVAEDLQININGAEVYDIEPAKLPNLYHGKPLKMYGRYKEKGEAAINVAATVNGRQIETTSNILFPGVDKDNPEIERMWAWHRMESLNRKYEINRSPALVDEIVRLGEGYSITSEYTSFLVLENNGEYKRWKIERRNATRIQRDREAQQRLGRELEALRGQGLNDIGPIKEKNTVINMVAANKPEPQVSTPADVISPAPLTKRPAPSRSFDMPRFSGGGAMDPVSGLVGICLAAGAFLRRRKKK